jgi:hypothetical protein
MNFEASCCFSIFGLNPKLFAAMKPTLLLTVSALCLLSSGCSLSHNLLTTTVIQPHQFCNYWEERREQHRYRAMARRELQREQATACVRLDEYGGQPYSVHQQRGFEDGFVDYLVYGGSGNPPSLPPRRYWRMKYQNQQGYQAVQDWYQGFEHGVQVAQATGYRDFITVQTRDALVSTKLPVYPGQSSYIESVESIEPYSDAPEDQPPANLPADTPEPPAKPIPDVESPPEDARTPANRDSNWAGEVLPSDLVAISKRPDGSLVTSGFESSSALSQSATQHPHNDLSTQRLSIKRLPPWPETQALSDSADEPQDPSVRLASYSIGVTPPLERTKSQDSH